MTANKEIWNTKLAILDSEVAKWFHGKSHCGTSWKNIFYNSPGPTNVVKESGRRKLSKSLSSTGMHTFIHI